MGFQESLSCKKRVCQDKKDEALLPGPVGSRQEHWMEAEASKDTEFPGGPLGLVGCELLSDSVSPG